jgi:hypothetical protein
MLATNPKSNIRRLAFILLPVLLLAFAGGFLAQRLWPAAPAPTRGAPPISPAIEEKWGVRITQIGVTADGGLVDFRFMVIDPDKALALLQDVNKLPVLVAEDSGTLVNSFALHGREHNFNPGQTYYVLYRNTRGAIKPGTAVTVKFGDLQLEHFVAK